MKYILYALYFIIGSVAGFGILPKSLWVGISTAAAFLILIIIEIIIDRKKKHGTEIVAKILDTSVIIDGRISDLCESGFLEGNMMVPKFVLLELQHIADSPEPMKRTKGRRGLDVLNNLKKCKYVNIVITDKDYTSTRQVDEKLVLMAKEFKWKVITNDYNLNKIAEIQGVEVLNINDLSNAIKPIFLPGEKIYVKVMKEGKEREQGVAYLSDGTMIVVDNGRKMLNKRIEVVVTNVLQTEAGRMIFAKFEGQGQNQNQGQNHNQNHRHNH